MQVEGEDALIIASAEFFLNDFRLLFIVKK